jgi:putative transposase
MSRPSKFPAEFRARGVQLYRDSEGRTIAEVARELGVGTETFRKWVRQDEADRGVTPDKPTSAQLAELARVKKENAELRRTNEILRLASSFFRPGGRPDAAAAVRFVAEHRAEFGVAPLCRVVGLPVSTFYDRIGRPTSARAVADADLAERIEKVWADSGRSYGSPRVHACLAREGIRVGRKRVERIMAESGWQGAYLRRGWKITTQSGQPAIPVPDLVDRDFTAARPNQLWVADITYVRTMVGLFYLAMVLDVFSRRIIGWMMTDTLRTELVLAALEMAVHHRDTGPFAATTPRTPTVTR